METWPKKEEADGSSAVGGQDAPTGTAASPMLHSVADFYRSQPVLDRRVHILGVGNVGSFIAHSIRGIPNPPPVTLLFPSWDRLNAWQDSEQRLSLVTEGDTEMRSGYDAELAIPRIRYHGKEVGLTSTAADDSAILEGESSAPISSLIVCSKAPVVLQGLSAVKHRLTRDSVILFLQNGMGIVDAVSRELFPDPATRPHYMLGINSHGMHSADTPFTTVHAGFGTIALGILPHERDRDPSSPYAPRDRTYSPKQAIQHSPSPGTTETDVSLPSSSSTPWTPNQRYLLRTLLRTPVLAATAFSPPDLLQMQLEKLAVNCIINPLSVLLDARNGSILYNYALTRTMRLLLAEISLVFRSLPELQFIPNVASRFDPGRLETLVVSVAQKTKDNVSSMLADVRAGRATEIDYINGWVVRRGEELGVRCTLNYAVSQLVKGKAQMISLERSEGVPFVGERMPGAKHGAELEVRRGVAVSGGGGEDSAHDVSSKEDASGPKL
jgi:2-dehydropantoate 2-reductase